MKKKFKIKSKVWLYPTSQSTDSSWHFITLEKALSEQIRQTFPKGFVKISAKVGKSSWQTSLFPHRQSKSYLLCIKNAIRKKEQIFEGDNISVDIEII